MKILHLVLYSKEEYYDKMKELTSNFYKLYNKNVDTYYYYFDENIKDNYELIENNLKIKGKESWIPGILDKTIKAFKYFENKLDNYDYIIRSNISTIIDFNKLLVYLDNSIIYSSGLVNDWYGTKYASGTNIILNKEGTNYLIDNKLKLDMTIIDDVSIGLLMNNITKPHLLYSLFFTFFTYEGNKNSIIFRNRTENRYDDVKKMEEIVNNIK
jgi:hypothetical protein